MHHAFNNLPKLSPAEMEYLDETYKNYESIGVPDLERMKERHALALRQDKASRYESTHSSTPSVRVKKKKRVEKKSPHRFAKVTARSKFGPWDNSSHVDVVDSPHEFLDDDEREELDFYNDRKLYRRLAR